MMQVTRLLIVQAFCLRGQQQGVRCVPMSTMGRSAYALASPAPRLGGRPAPPTREVLRVAQRELQAGRRQRYLLSSQSITVTLLMMSLLSVNRVILQK